MAKTNDDMAIQTKALLAGGLAAVAAGAAWLLARKGNPADDDTVISDAPAWTLHSANQGARPIAAKTLLIGRSRPDLYEAWKDFARFPSFMENVEAIETLDATRSRWTIKAPAGKTVTASTREATGISSAAARPARIARTTLVIATPVRMVKAPFLN